MFYPNLGRWMQQDPIGFEAGDPNLVRYVENNPTNLVDPTGLQAAYDRYYVSKAERASAVLKFGTARALRGSELAKQALEATQNKFPGAKLHNDKADAWRHCVWSALMAKDPALKPAYIPREGGGFGSSYEYIDFAWAIGNDHEEFGSLAGQPQIEFAMDMHNNNVGLGIGRALGEAASLEDVCKACDKALEDGKLIWIVDGQLTAPAVYNRFDKTELGRKWLDNFQRPWYKQITTDRSGKPDQTGDPFCPHDVTPFK